jgi:hypothetical protein
MCVTWGSLREKKEPEKRQKKFIRMWGYLAIAGLFLIYVAQAVRAAH